MTIGGRVPSYDYYCPDCGYETELVHRISQCDEVHSCDSCGSSMARRPRSGGLVGPMPTKPVRVGGLDREFTRMEDLRTYERENPDVKVMSRGDSWFRNHMDDVRSRREAAAKKLGYNDLDHKKSLDKEAQKKGRVAHEV